MRLVCAILLLVCYTLAQQTNIDQVNQMLTQLRDTSDENLKILEEAWKQSSSSKRQTLQALHQTREEQVAECERREHAIGDKQEQIDSTTEFLAWVQVRINANDQRIELLEALRCQQFENYIQTVKDKKIQLIVAAFLRQQIQRIVDENSSFFQKSEAMAQITQFIEKINNNQIDILNMQREAESQLDEKITALLEAGVSQMGPFEFQRFQEAKNEVIVALDDIESHINEHMPVGQQNMIRSGLTYKVYKQNIEKENEVFQRHVVELNDKLTNYRDQLTTYQHALQQCHQRINEFETSINLTEEDLHHSQEQFESQRTHLQEEQQTFQEVYDIYQGNVIETTDDADRQQIQWEVDRQDQQQGEQHEAVTHVAEEHVEEDNTHELEVEHEVEHEHENESNSEVENDTVEEQETNQDVEEHDHEQNSEFILAQVQQKEENDEGEIIL